jgi:hypothetical protein
LGQTKKEIIRIKEMKKILFIYLFIYLLTNSFSQENKKRINIDVPKYEIYEVTKKIYPSSEVFVKTYDNLKKKGYKIKIGIIREKLTDKQSIDLNGEKEYIKEIVYFLEKSKEITPLGRFSKKSKFIDGFGREDIFWVNEDIVKNNFLGFPLNETLNWPFSLSGIAKFTNSDELYFTELLVMLEIDDVTLNIKKHELVLD